MNGDSENGNLFVHCSAHGRAERERGGGYGIRESGKESESERAGERRSESDRGAQLAGECSSGLLFAGRLLSVGSN